MLWSTVTIRDMVDTLSKEKRSWLMSRVRPSRTLPERLVEKSLREQRIRFRRHDRRLPGTPDIIIPDRRIIIFVNGCFWHGHKRCRCSRLPSTRTKFWSEKIQTNRRRDLRVRRSLRRMGWKVFTVWGCHTRNKENLNRVVANALAPKQVRPNHTRRRIAQ